jgi:glutathione peroxidase
MLPSPKTFGITTMANPLYEIPLNRIDGTKAKLGDYAGSVLLVVNVASQCGKTPQYEGLEQMYEKYRDKGFAVLGFPSNQFDGQEPGTNEEIAEFCRTVYGVGFPMFAKLDVKGPGQHSLYKTLTSAQRERTVSPAMLAAGKQAKPGPDVRWNFEKFLVGRDGNVVGRFDPDVIPADETLVKAVEKALG